MPSIGIIGFGFMGRTHFRAYLEDGRAEVRAIAEQKPERVRAADGMAGLGAGRIDAARLASARLEPSAEAVLEDPSIDAVSICVPTPLHAPLAIAALERGKHVLVEKPVALDAAEGEAVLAAAAARPALVCMPAMCMRFWPGWRWLRDVVRAGAYGAPRSAVFTRLGTRPRWGDGFYDDPARCGGAILDLHIHDADFVRYCFGDPVAVESRGVRGPEGGIDHAITSYRFDDGAPLVTAEGGWLAASSWPFTMRYRVDFDAATVAFDLAANPPLVRYAHDGGAEPVALPPGDGYRLEIAHFLDCIERGAPSDVVTIADGVAAVRLVEAERRSAERNERVPV